MRLPKDIFPRRRFYDKKDMITFEPCMRCGKKPHSNYSGLCMDCSDILNFSELFRGRITDTYKDGDTIHYTDVHILGNIIMDLRKFKWYIKRGIDGKHITDTMILEKLGFKKEQIEKYYPKIIAEKL